MASVNMAIVVGFVGNDPRITTLQSGRKCASFALATTEAGYTTQSGQQIPERTEWHNIVVWGKTAEVVEKYVHKGSSLYIQGKIRNRSFDGQDGQKRYITEIECELMQMLDRRQDGNNPSQAQNTAQNPQTASNPYNSSPAPFPPPQAQENGSDDLPF